MYANHTLKLPNRVHISNKRGATNAHAILDTIKRHFASTALTYGELVLRLQRGYMSVLVADEDKRLALALDLESIGVQVEIT